MAIKLIPHIFFNLISLLFRISVIPLKIRQSGNWHALILSTLAIAIGMSSTKDLAAEGKYFRFGIGLEKLAETEFTDVDCSDSNFGYLWGCGTGPDGNRRRSFGDFGTTNLLEFGLGYETDSSVRYEFLFEYRPKYTFRGVTNYNVGPHPSSAKLSSISGMIAFFIDMKKSGIEQKSVPYIGAGFGLVRHKIGTHTLMFPRYNTQAPGNKSSDKAWMVTSGIEMPLDKQMSLDIAWRYTDLGKVTSGAGNGKLVWNDDRPDIPLSNLAPTHTRLKGHGIRISLRRKF